MIVRLIVLCLGGAAAYVLLKGMPAVLPPLVRSCLAVLLLVGGLGVWAIGRKADDAIVAKGSGKPGLRDFLAMGMGVLALECGFLWVLSAAPEPLEDVAAVIELKLRPQAAADRAAGGAGGRTGNWLWEDEGSRVLPMRTNLKPGAKPEVFVRLSREEDAEKLLARKTYVRAFALDDYRKGVWSLAEPGGLIMEADASGWIRFGERLDGEILHEVFHGKDEGGRDVVTSLQGMRAVRLPELLMVSEGMAVLPDVSGPDGFGYLAGSVPLGLEDLKGVDLGWQLNPAGGGGRLAELAQKAAGEGDALRRLLNIQEFLRQRYSYSLVTENTRNLDPLENFLFVEKRGHCEFFATAGALLAREIGAETRVAYGWAGGEYFKGSMMFVFRAREAHAWVEVKVPGYGWAVMEPTPPVFLGGGGVPRRADAGEAPPPRDELPMDEAVSTQVPGGHVGGVALSLTAAFGALALLAFIAKALRSPIVAEGFASLPQEAEKPGYLRAWIQACQDRGLAWQRGVTLKKRLEGMERRPPFADEFLGYHYGVNYEGHAPDPQREANLVQKIRRWE
ncbi:transglutaminase domain-containing protein [Akkermansiaceae bacterium]|nr:transglutaminase domain-containing protein [Akkermansiaceae bacterium]